MELNGDETIAELAALRVAVKRLLEVANDQSVEKGHFARNALCLQVHRHKIFARMDRRDLHRALAVSSTRFRAH